MPSVPANENHLEFTDIKYTQVSQWGDYKEKVKWKLKEKAKNRGFILQVVIFTFDVKWVENDQPVSTQELFGDQASWVGGYSELWLISAGNNQPAGTLNQDHFRFESIEDTYGWMKEEGVAYFFESSASASSLGFEKNEECPAGPYMPSKKGIFNPIDVVKTANINHAVHVKWDKTGTTTIVQEIPNPD